MNKKLRIYSVLLIASCFFVSTLHALTLNTSTIYNLNSDHIALINSDINVPKEDIPTSFEDSMAQLDEEIIGDVTGVGETYIYFDENNPNDANENIVKVDLDFAGNVLPSPTNVEFIMDQSGSMNMASERESYGKNTSACMNPNHYYRLIMQANYTDTSGVYKTQYFIYYLNPQVEGITESWGSTTTTTNIPIVAKKHAVAEGLIPSDSVVKDITAYTTSENPEDIHYSINDTSQNESVKKTYAYVAASGTTPSNRANPTQEELAVFTKIDLGHLHDDGSSEVYMSPDELYEDSVRYPQYTDVVDYREVGSQAYFDYLLENNLCFDRMMVSKAIFYELSNIALAGNPDNTFGYINFAMNAHGSRTLLSQNLDPTFEYEKFTYSKGYGGTNYSLGISEATKAFEEVSYVNSGQNITIFVTDGAPYGGLSGDALEGQVSTFVDTHNVIMYYVGIDLDPSVFSKYESILSTDNASGEPQAFNGETLAELMVIRDELEKVLTSTTSITTNLGELFTLKLDDTHGLEITYVLGKNTEPVVKKVNSIDELEELGIIYNEETGSLVWTMGQVGITHARISFYQQVDESKIDWEVIEGGGEQSGSSLEETIIDFIDYTGTPAIVELDKTTQAMIKNYSKLTIENTTSTQEKVAVGEDIHYTITVKNEGNITAENLIVRQVVPENTVFKSSDKAIYDASENELTYTIDALEAGQSTSFTYIATANVENSVIHSSAQLGVANKAHTLDAQGNPILSAVVLTHYTTSQAVVDPEDSIIPPSTSDTSNRGWYYILIAISSIAFISRRKLQ